MDRQRLLDDLLRELETGSLDPDVVLPVIRALRARTAAPPPSRWTLLRELDGFEGTEFQRLRRALLRGLLESARAARAALRDGAPMPAEQVEELGGLPVGAPRGWHTAADCAAALTKIVRAHEELEFVRALPERLPRVEQQLERLIETHRTEARTSMPPWALLAPTELLERAPGNASKAALADWLRTRKAEDLDAALDGADRDVYCDENALLATLLRRFQSSSGQEEQVRILDRVLAWPTMLAASILPELCEEPWAQDRATLMLHLRLGPEGSARPETWTWWLRWIRELRELLTRQRTRVEGLAAGHEPTLLRHWYACQPDTDPALQDALDAWSRDTLPPISAEEFLRRRGALLERAEFLAIESAGGVAAAPALQAPEPKRPVPPPVPAEAAEAEPEVVEAPPAAPEIILTPEPLPAAPSFWARHVQTFFAENWFMVAGILMVVVGASILAYFTWDKHWLIRYTIMPTLLGGFTFALAGLGRFLEKQEDDLANAAAMLRGAAILLLPINFMAVTFLWDDDSVPGFVVPLMAAIYLGVFGWGVRRWCAAVHPALKWIGGGTLVFLNFLVFLRPLGNNVLAVAEQPMRMVLGIGFYAGFLIMAGAVLYFTERVLTEEMAREKRVPWFFGLTLGVTYLQVFAWVHGLAKLVPQVHTYAPMIVLAGGLVLYLERKGLELRGKQQRHEVESFLGFALILLGVLMAAGHDLTRIVAFLLAGLIWTLQGAKRNQDLHRWIGLTLLFLGGASIGAHSAFPAAWRPAVGLASAAAFLIASRALLRRNPADRTAQIAYEMVAPILLLTALVAVVTQWTQASEPLWTATVLVAVATWFVLRSVSEQRVRWLFTAMVMLATALPYLGCIDLSRRTWHGNTMVFGLAVLSLLWIGANVVFRTPLMRSARSSVLWTYGTLAVAGMVVRVLLEPVTPADAESLRVLMNYSGPLLMAVALAIATYTSRSIVPAFMAMTIVIILFPELQARFDEELQAIGWGTGIGSAVNALWMTLICFALRAWSRLRDLGEGDRFLGMYAFPLIRTDYKLFTWPLMVSALFLLLRTNTVTYWRNLPDTPDLTALALCVAGAGWTAQAVYHSRERPGAPVGTHLGWMSLLLGLAHWLTWPADWPAAQGYFLVLGLVLVGLYALYRLPPIGRQPWARPVLSSQIRWVLAAFAVVFTVLWIPLLFHFDSTDLAPWFVLLLAVLNAWTAIRAQWHVFGGLLFFLCGTYVTTRFTDWMPDDLWTWMPASALWYLLCVQVLLAVLAFEKRLDGPLRALRQSLSVLSAGTLLGAGLFVVLVSLVGEDVVVHDRILLLIGLLLAAWSTGSSAFILVAALAGYTFIRRDWFTYHGTDGLAVLGAVLIGLSLAGRRLARTAPQFLQSRHAWRFEFLRQPIPWLPVPAAFLAVLAAGQYAETTWVHESFGWIWVPYLCGVTLSAVAIRTRWHILHGLTLVVVTMGNIFGVRALVGEQLTAWGLSDLHTICLGVLVSLAELTALRQAMRSFRIRIYIGRSCLALAGLVLLLLSANYLAHPDLAGIQWQRFGISGVMAVLTGLYFRAVARSPDPAIRPYVRLCEGLYHYGLALGIGCFALLVPFLRTPATAMFALGMPALFFYARAEMLYGTHREIAERYRNSARVICFILLGLYLLRPAYQMAFFPNDPVQVDSYHWNAPLVMLLGIVMIRLRGLGASHWLSYFGGLAMMLASYFLLTWLPGLSPFSDPVPAAWCAVVLAHFWMAVSNSASPLRTAIQRIGALPEEEWDETRASWGWFLLVGLHAAAFWGLSNCEPTMPMAFAPLLAGVATVGFHQGYLRGARWLYALAGIELLVALHADMFIESAIPLDAVVWIVLGLWAAALTVQAFVGRRLDVRSLQAAAGALFALCLAHALHHELWSTAGLWIVGLATALVSLTPQERAHPERGEERLGAGAVLFLPVWLTYFGLIGPAPTVDSAVEPWPVGMATLVLVAVAAGLRWCATQLPSDVRLFTPGTPRLVDHTRCVVMAAGRPMGVWMIWVALGITALIHLAYAGRELPVREHWLFLALYTAIGWAGWAAHWPARPGTATVLLELSAIGLLIALRTFVVQTNPGLWEPEYDVWAALVLSMLLTGSKQFLDRGPSEVRRALLPGLFLLPAFSILWTLGQGLGTDVMLIVVGLNSLMFSYLGKDARESPYRLVSIAGFVAFVLITFHAKFEFRQVHAYVIPVGLGILALVHMLQRTMTVETRNRIRTATLLTMLASSGYYALVDESHTLAFNVTLFLLCLAAMAAGALLRVRLFLVMGFAGLVVSLASIFYRVLRAMEHTVRLTAVGLLVLLVGVVFVMGTVYYKTHRDRVNAALAKWQRKIGDWE